MLANQKRALNVTDDDIEIETKSFSFNKINNKRMSNSELIKGLAFRENCFNYNEGIFHRSFKTGNLNKNKVKDFCAHFDLQYKRGGFKFVKPRHLKLLSKERLQLVIYSAALHARDHFGYSLNGKCSFKIITLKFMKRRAFLILLDENYAINSIAIFYKKGKKFVYGISKYENLL